MLMLPGGDDPDGGVIRRAKGAGRLKGAHRSSPVGFLIETSARKGSEASP